MASLLENFFRKTPNPSFQLLASLTKSQHRIPFLPSPLPSSNPNLDPASSYPNSEEVKTSPLLFRPSFPHFFNLDPLPLSGILRSDAGLCYAGDVGGRIMWADSVKKKRKRKMNKHKYRKLRKRIRRQT
ncbi:hypothetical protein KSP39_PZI023303 [Platanthera zijinensis]|uniref:Small ribosomal subunit protein mS38 n=1 Tax=Platanthera zijinensis TaxID=2320716 RepID=A0AAP0AUJ2_9ASPA